MYSTELLLKTLCQIIGVGTVFEVDNKPPMMQAVEVEDDENPEETMKRAMKHLSLHPPVTVRQTVLKYGPLSGVSQVSRIFQER